MTWVFLVLAFVANVTLGVVVGMRLTSSWVHSVEGRLAIVERALRRERDHSLGLLKEVRTEFRMVKGMHDEG